MRRFATHSVLYCSNAWALIGALLVVAVGPLVCWGESGFTLAPYSATSSLNRSGVASRVSSDESSWAIQQAQKLWQHYQTYESAYDPGLARVYAETATVQIQHQRANGNEPVTEIIPTGQYQQSIRQLMSVAKAAGDCSLYENVRFVEKGAWVIVQATRVDGRGGYRVPHWVTILPDATNPLGGTVVAEVAVIQEAQ